MISNSPQEPTPQWDHATRTSGALIAEVKNKLTNINSEFFNLVASIVVETVTPPPQCRRLHSVTATCVFTTLSPIPDSKEAVPLDSLIRIVHTDNKNERYCVDCGFPHNFQLKEEIVELAPITVINVQRNGLQQTFSNKASYVQRRLAQCCQRYPFDHNRKKAV